MNSANGSKMTAEVICWGKPTSSYTSEWGPFCNNLDSQKYILTIKDGDHVRVIGKYVQDIGYPTGDDVLDSKIAYLSNIITVYNYLDKDSKSK